MRQLIGYLLVFVPIVLIYGYIFKDNWKEGLIAASLTISIVAGLLLLGVK